MVKKGRQNNLQLLSKEKNMKRRDFTVKNKYRKDISGNEDELSPCSQISAWFSSSERLPIFIFFLFFF